MRRAHLVIGVLAFATVAAVLVARTPALRQWFSRPATERPEVDVLFAALAAESVRPIDGRLAGGFPYAPAAVPTRGVPSSASPDVRIAAATIEKRVAESQEPVDRAALGAAYLVLGDWDRAVTALEEAVAASPDVAVFLNDLAAALLARATAAGRPEDWVGALDAASRAIRLEPRRPEPYFNRALALRGLHLGAEEAAAWAAYPSIEATGPWSLEAADRLTAARNRSRSRPSDAGVFDHQIVRERIEDRLLRDWGSAVAQQDHAVAERMLDEADHLATRLAANGGDAMARDEIAHIRRVQRSGDMVSVQALAAGHRAYGDVRELWLANRWAEADRLMVRAADDLRRGGSLYWQWKHYFHAVVLGLGGDAPAAIRHLQSLPPPDPGRHYLNLRGRLAWTEGFMWASQSRFDLARTFLARAVEEFRSAREDEYLAATHANLAESEWYLGDAPSAWSNLLVALSLFDQRGEVRRFEHLQLASLIAIDEGRPDAALLFDAVLVGAVRSPLQRADILLRRARTQLRLGRGSAAAADLDKASAALKEFGTSVIDGRIAAEIAAVRAEVSGTSDCQQTMRHAAEALSYFSGGHGLIWLGSLLRTRALCQASSGNLAAARNDLRAAVRVYEERRSALAMAVRAGALELERRTFRQLLLLEAVNLGDETAAFETAERARSGAVAEAWHDAAPAVAGGLPAGVAAVYYESLPDRVLVWVLTGERRASFSRPIDEAALRREVSRIRAAIARGADLAALRSHSADFFDALVAPALEMADRDAGSAVPRVVFVPDGPLFALPFNALPDAQGRPLFEKRTIAIAPSVKTFLAASARLAAFTPDDVLAIGDGHDPATTGLPMLPRADAEAVGIGRLYTRRTVLAGSAATRGRVLATRASVMHFAGHTVLDERYPSLSRMLLSPDPAAGESGWLLESEINRERFGSTRVVVLASCEGATGRVIEGEGAVSVGRAFFAAGVPAVVASLWAVDDDLQTLMTTFHRMLREQGDPAEALRQAQLALWRERGPRAPVRVWGGFVMLGGLRPATE
jgi:CHAT domain-containing protein